MVLAAVKTFQPRFRHQIITGNTGMYAIRYPEIDRGFFRCLLEDGMVRDKGGFKLPGHTGGNFTVLMKSREPFGGYFLSVRSKGKGFAENNSGIRQFLFRQRQQFPVFLFIQIGRTFRYLPVPEIKVVYPNQYV